MSCPVFQERHINAEMVHSVQPDGVLKTTALTILYCVSETNVCCPLNRSRGDPCQDPDAWASGRATQNSATGGLVDVKLGRKLDETRAHEVLTADNMDRNIETSDEPVFPASLYPQPWYTNKRWVSLRKASTLLRCRYSQHVLDLGKSCEILPRHRLGTIVVWLT